MKRDALKTFGTVVLVANIVIAFLSLTNLFLIAAGAIAVDVPGPEDFDYEYDAENRTILFETAFTVQNKGIYSVKNLDIEARLVTDSGYELVSFARKDLEVRPGEVRTFPVVVNLPVETLVDREALRLLVEDGSLELTVKVHAVYTLGLTKFSSKERMEYPWKAPLAHLGEFLTSEGFVQAVEEALGWAGPVVRETVSQVLLDSALNEGEWRSKDIGGWADLSYRLDLNETSGLGALDVRLDGDMFGFPWSLEGSVPLKIVDGTVYLAREVIPDDG